MRVHLLIATSVALTVAPTADAQRRGRPQKPVDLEHCTHENVKFDSPSLDRAQGDFGVYLPASYAAPENAEREYPLVLWLHGLNEDASRFHHEGGAKVLDTLLGEGELPELILVAPTASRRTVYANGEADGDFESYILEDLLSYVEDHYRVSSERSLRAIMGVSMGGMGSLRIAMKYPEYFGSVAVHSAAAFPADPTKMSENEGARVQRTVQWLQLGGLLGDPIDPVKWSQFIPSAMVGRIDPDSLEGLRIYLDAGTADRYGFGPPNQAFHEQLEARGIESTFTMVQDGGHSWGSGSLQKQLVTSLKFVAAGFLEAETEEVTEEVVEEGDGEG